MAALDFPDNPTNGQVFDKWTWNGTMWVLTASGSGGGGSGFTFNQDAVPTATRIGDTWYETDTGDSFVWTNDGNSTQWVQFAPGSGGGGGSGFTYVTDTKPTPSKVGDTWFDTSTLASGGTSWLAIEESPGGEKVWVQFAPGAGAPPLQPVFGQFTLNGQAIAANTSTFVGFTEYQADRTAGITSRANGYFALTEKGIYTVSVKFTWASAFGFNLAALDLCVTENQGAATSSIGTQMLGPTPWAVTENTFTLDYTQANVTAGREIQLRVYNYGAAMSTTLNLVRVQRVSFRP